MYIFVAVYKFFKIVLLHKTFSQIKEENTIEHIPNAPPVIDTQNPPTYEESTLEKY